MAPAPPPASASLPASARPDADLGPGTLVIEDGVIPRRLRRPLDLVRFGFALAAFAGVVLLAYFATSTTTGIDADLTSASRNLPNIIQLLLNLAAILGVVGLPIAAAIDLLVRRRGRQLLDALVALVLAAGIVLAANALLHLYDNRQLILALAGSVAPDSTPLSAPLAAIVAFVTVARLISRSRWNVLTVLVVGSLGVVALFRADITTAGIALSILLGWAVGLIVRYSLGTPTTRPRGIEVAEAMERGGFGVSVLRAQETTEVGRRYIATTRSGEALTVVVLDRDLEGAGLVRSAWRAIRLADDPGTGVFNMRRALDHHALMSYATEVADAPIPRLLLASEVGPDSAVLVHERVQGKRFDELGDTLTDDDLVGAWRAMATLHRRRVAHRALTADHLLRGVDGRVWLLGTASGSIAASDVAERIDIAELLCTLALLTDPGRALRTGQQVLGVTTLARALPALQPVALSPSTRRAVRRNKGLLLALRDGLQEIRPDAAVEQIKLERIRPRTILTILAGLIAAFVLVSQLAQVDLVAVFRSAQWEWAVVAAIASLITYVGATLSLSGFVPERISLLRTMLAQVAGDFATLVAPPTLGAVAINVRFLTKAGLHPALAGASVGVSQVAAFGVHLCLLVGFGIAAGTQTDLSFDPPRWVVIGILVLAALALAATPLPPVRRQLAQRVAPLLREVGPRMITIAQRPLKLVEGFGGIVLLNLAYIAVLVASVKAFGGDLPVATVAVVYLAGATIGQAAPTPGGVGAVEGVMAGALTVAGVDAGIALSAVLLYRVVTFWVPTVPGWFAFNWLQKHDYL
ncbi:MAG: flippase-like domain-containing protein [Actinomycetota bacterium]|nr:MAG: flippase-like domain-containing protein [Actinomycetota bacterium]